jgi:hypothetical protein
MPLKIAVSYYAIFLNLSLFNFFNLSCIGAGAEADSYYSLGSAILVQKLKGQIFDPSTILTAS